MGEKHQRTDKGEASFSYDSEWKDLLEHDDFKRELREDILESYIIKQRWYGAKSSTLKYIEIIDNFVIDNEENDRFFGIVIEVNFKEAFVQNYFIPIGLVDDASYVDNNYIAKLELNDLSGYLVDAILLGSFRKLVFQKIIEGRKDKYPNIEYRKGRKCEPVEYKSSKFLGAEQSNTSIIYNDAYILKFFRRVYIDQNPDYEISKYLTNKGHFKNTPGYSGSITLRFSDKNVITLALMQELVPNEGDAWDYFLKNIKEAFFKIREREKETDWHQLKKLDPFERVRVGEIDHTVLDLCGRDFFEDVEKLAFRTAQMHVSLGLERISTAFTPAPYSYDYTVWLKNRVMYMLDNRINLLENSLHKLEGMRLDLAQEILANKKLIKKRFLDFDEAKLKSERIRIHGDYHLGQVLVQDRDFYIIDFEGEPESTIRDRKVKQPPIKDVAGMFRSFNYAVYSIVFTYQGQLDQPLETLSHIADVIYSNMVSVFLNTYINEVQINNLNIGYDKEIEFLLQYCLLEKAVYELGYELNARPRWTIIPLKGISNILNDHTYE